MPRYKVLLTDYAWPDLDIERGVLAAADAELVVADAADADTLAGLAGHVDAIMTNWANVPAGVIEAAPKCRIVARLGIGIGSPPETVAVSYGFMDGLLRGIQQSWDMAVTTVKLIGRILVGEASVKNFSGPLTIGDYAGKSAQSGLSTYLAFLATLSMSLAVLNLLPLPMLDGGHLMYYLFEGVTGRPVSEVWLDRLQRGGFAIMVLMMSLALYNDLARMLGLH